MENIGEKLSIIVFKKELKKVSSWQLQWWHSWFCRTVYCRSCRWLWLATLTSFTFWVVHGQLFHQRYWSLFPYKTVPFFNPDLAGLLQTRKPIRVLYQLGLSIGLETLCGQAYGAEQYKKLGIYTYTSIISLTIVCLPITLIWIFSDKLLMLMGQDHSISHVAQSYSIFIIPNLFCFGILQSLTRYFQTQSVILPMLYSSIATL